MYVYTLDLTYRIDCWPRRKRLMPGRDPGGFIVTALIGIAGAFVAHMLGRAMGWYTEGQAAGFIASVVGAIMLLAVYRMVLGRKTIA